MSLRQFSVMRLLSNLVNTAPAPVIRTDHIDDGSKINTTIRLDPTVRQFVEDQAEHYGISTQQFISMMLKGLMVSGSHEVVNQASLMESRIYDLFARSKMTPPKVAAILKPFGINASVLKDPQLLLSMVTPDFIRHLSETFFVREQWLSGVDGRIFQDQNFDRAQYPLVLRILEMRAEAKSVEVHFVMEDGYRPLTDEGDYGWADTEGDAGHAGFVVEFRGEVGSRYLIVRPQPWGYKRTRMEMKTFLMFLEKGSSYYFPLSGFKSWTVDKVKFNALFAGKSWPEDILKFRTPGVKTGIDLNFYISDMVSESGGSPEEFEVEDVAIAYATSELPIIHDAYRETCTIDPEIIQDFVANTKKANKSLESSVHTVSHSTSPS